MESFIAQQAAAVATDGLAARLLGAHRETDEARARARAASSHARSTSHVAESDHCMSSSTTTTGRCRGGFNRRYATTSPYSVYLLPARLRAGGTPDSAGTRRGYSPLVPRRCDDADLMDRRDHLGPRCVEQAWRRLPRIGRRRANRLEDATAAASRRTSVDLPTPASPTTDTNRGPPSSVDSSNRTSRCISSSRPTNCLRLMAGSRFASSPSVRRRVSRAAALRLVQRFVRRFEQARRSHCARSAPPTTPIDMRDGDRTRAHAQWNGRASHGAANALRELGGLVDRRMREKNDELVARVAADDSGGLGEFAQRTGDDAKDRVPLQVAVRVVDVLEFVDVDDEERHRRKRAAFGQNLVRDVDERPAHEQAGEIVGRAADGEVARGRAVDRLRLDGRPLAERLRPRARERDFEVR